MTTLRNATFAALVAGLIVTAAGFSGIADSFAQGGAPAADPLASEKAAAVNQIQAIINETTAKAASLEQVIAKQDDRTKPYSRLNLQKIRDSIAALRDAKADAEKATTSAQVKAALAKAEGIKKNNGELAAAIEKGKMAPDGIAKGTDVVDTLSDNSMLLESGSIPGARNTDDRMSGDEFADVSFSDQSKFGGDQRVGRDTGAGGPFADAGSDTLPGSSESSTSMGGNLDVSKQDPDVVVDTTSPNRD